MVLAQHHHCSQALWSQWWLPVPAFVTPGVEAIMLCILAAAYLELGYVP